MYVPHLADQVSVLTVGSGPQQKTVFLTRTEKRVDYLRRNYCSRFGASSTDRGRCRARIGALSPLKRVFFSEDVGAVCTVLENGR